MQRMNTDQIQGWPVTAAVLIFSLLLPSVSPEVTQIDGPEHKLYLDLFSDYTAESRPVKNASHTVQVTFALALNQLLDLDEKNQILSTSVWIYEEWKDEMLRWSPSDYDGQQAIMIPADSVWLPDIFIFNTAGANMDGFVNVNGSKVAVEYDGTVRWMVPLMVASVCAVDVTYFPYDQQACVIKFGSWIYDIDQVDIVTESTVPDLEHYVMNSEYDLKNVSISRGVLGSSCCPGNGRHSMVELKIELRRKSLYYDYIVIAPTIMLCVLTLASFLLPCDRGEKMAIGLTVFLTLYVLQLRIADNVPDTNSTPILGVFMLIVMTFNCVSLIMATIVMNIKKRGDDSPCPDVPVWLFSLCHYVFGRVVCTPYMGTDHLQFLSSPQDPNKNKEQSNAKKVTSNEMTQAIGESTSRLNKDEKNTHLNSTPPFLSPTLSPAIATTQENHMMVNDAKKKGIKRSPGEGTDQPDLDPRASLSTTDGVHCYDPHKTPRLKSEGETEMRLRKAKLQAGPSKGDNSASPGSTVTTQSAGPLIKSSIDRVYLMKRRWFYVAEVVDKFLFLVYLVLLTTSIFTVLFLIPVYFRND
ncbi:unnamed protein product [Lymnaea stagnalis]|uniref:Uncharacterized protein n=1 Tax=Lymnaea stagnalis TaxID=6523 RepID=A0AAV2H0F5_LYMST